MHSPHSSLLTPHSSLPLRGGAGRGAPAASAVDDLAERLRDCKDEDIIPLAGQYDLTYRLTYGRKPDPAFMRSLYRRAFDAWRAGGSRIAESDIFAMIAPRVGNPHLQIDEDQVIAYHAMLRSWLRILDQYDTFPGVTTYENLTRLSLLLRHRIKPYLSDPTDARRRWYDRNRIDDLSGLSPLLRSTYRRYLSSLIPDVIAP